MTTKLALWSDRIIEGGWLMLVIATPVFFNIYSSRVFEPDKMTVFRCIIAVMAAAWAIRTLERTRGAADFATRLKQTVQTSAGAITALIFGAVVVLTTLTSIDPALSFWGSYQRMQGSLNLLGYVLAFFMVLTTMRSRAQVERLITAVLIASAYVSFYGVLQRLEGATGVDFDPLPWGGDVTDRVTSSLGNAIFLGAYVLMAMPLALVRLIQVIAPLWKAPVEDGSGPPVAIWRQSALIALYTGLLGMQTIALVWTKSRGPWLGGAAALVFVVIVLLLRNRQYKLTAGISAATVAALAFVVLLNVPTSPISHLRQASPYLDRLGTVLDLEQGTNKVRLLIWAGDEVGGGALGLITANPVRTLIGYGPETMYIAYNPFYPPKLANLEARNASPDRSHNDPLDFLVTMGVLGLLAFTTVFGAALVTGLRSIWRTDQLWLQLAAAGLLGGLVGHVFEALVGIAIAATRTHFFVYAGAIAALPIVMRLTQAVAVDLRQDTVPLTVGAPVAVGAGARGGSSVAVASPAGSGGRRKNGRRANGRGKSEPGSGRPHPTRSAVEAPPLIPGKWYALGYLIMTTLLVGMLFMATVRGPETARWVTENPRTALILMIAWVILGICCLAAWATRAERGVLTMRSQFVPLYVPIVVAALIAIGGVFLPNVEADIHYKLGFGYDGVQRWDQSVKSYLNAIDLQPNQDYYYLFLGRSYLELARRYPERPGLQAPQTMQDIKRLGLDLPRQERHSREQLFSAAFIVLTRAYELSPLNTDHSANLGRLHRFWGDATQDPALRTQRYEKAVEWHQEAITLSPNLAHLHDELGFTLVALGRYDDAEAEFTRAATLDPRYPTTFMHWGDMLLQQERLDEAAARYKQAVAIDRKLVQAHSALGYIYSRQGKLVEALQENLTAAELAPQDFATRRNLAFLYADLGQYGPALQQAQQALALAPQDQKPQLEQIVQQIRQRMQAGQ